MSLWDRVALQVVEDKNLLLSIFLTKITSALLPYIILYIYNNEKHVPWVECNHGNKARSNMTSVSTFAPASLWMRLESIRIHFLNKKKKSYLFPSLLVKILLLGIKGQLCHVTLSGYTGKWGNAYFHIQFDYSLQQIKKNAVISDRLH